jgi:hypothetical protein
MRDSIDDLSKYKDVNKSTIFLYSLLQVKSEIEPEGTYMNIDDCDIGQNMNLICLFYTDQEGFEFLDKQLRDHKQFSFLRDDRDGFRYYVMDFSMHYAIYKSVEQGRYSELPNNSKTVIMFSDHPIGRMGVSPESYYQEFSDNLEVSIEELKEKGEIISPPDEENETLVLPSDMTELFKT